MKLGGNRINQAQETDQTLKAINLNIFCFSHRTSTLPLALNLENREIGMKIYRLSKGFQGQPACEGCSGGGGGLEKMLRACPGCWQSGVSALEGV